MREARAVVHALRESITGTDRDARMSTGFYRAFEDKFRGSRELIKSRLDAQAKVLGEKVEALNARRLEVFGASELAVLGNERVRTENNCVPRDIANVSGHLFFAYNVFIGLRTMPARPERRSRSATPMT